MTEEEAMPPDQVQKLEDGIKAKDEEIRVLKEKNRRLEQKLQSSKDYAEELRLQVEKLGKKLTKSGGQNCGTQTTEKGFRIAAYQWHYGRVPTDLEDPTDWDIKADEEGSVDHAAIVSQVIQTAEAVTRTQGMVFEETSGLYYDYSTGYYYDADRALYYDGTTGTYYKYNPESKEYEVHSQVPPEELELAKKLREKADRKILKGKRRRRRSSESSTASGVTGGGAAPLSPREDGEVEDEALDRIEEASSDEESTDEDQIPCVRLIVSESGSDRVGTLFLVTRMGGTVGLEGVAEHDVPLADVGCSKFHAKITFQKQKYFLIDLGSRNGTYVNGKRLSASKSESDPHEIGHGSTIQIGTTRLLCHVHPGRETCYECEPGVVQQQNPKHNVRVNKEKERKKAMKNLRQKYGIAGASTTAGEEDKSKYIDRASERRKVVGSDNPHEKTEVASVRTMIPSKNKGFKMLEKMGWKEGDGLGKDEKGRKEPILVEQRDERAGLGTTVMPTMNPRAKQKADVWRKTQLRFEQIDDPTKDYVL